MSTPTKDAGQPLTFNKVNANGWNDGSNNYAIRRRLSATSDEVVVLSDNTLAHTYVRPRTAEHRFLLLSTPIREVQAEMEQLFVKLHPEETTFFVTPAMVLAWCKGRRSCYFYIANQLHTKQLEDSHCRSIAFAWHDRHM